LFDLFFQVAEANTAPDQVNENNGKSEEGEEECDFHVAGHAYFFLIGIRRADDDWVDGAKQADDHEGDRRADAAQQGVDCAKPRAFFGIVNALAQHKVGDIDQLGDGCGGQARVPGPPGVPGGTRPNGTQHNCQEEEDRADFHSGYFKTIPSYILGDEIHDAGKGGDDKPKQSDPGCADVKIKHALDLSHHQFGGGKEERQVGGYANTIIETTSSIFNAIGLGCMETPIKIYDFKFSCPCEEGALPDEAIPIHKEIASGKEQERPRKDILLFHYKIKYHEGNSDEDNIVNNENIKRDENFRKFRARQQAVAGFDSRQ